MNADFHLTNSMRELDGLQCTGCILKYRLEDGVSYRRTRQVTQLFTYLLTQRRTAATHRSVYICVMTQQDVHEYHQRLPKIWVGTFLVRSVYSPRERL